MLQRLEKLGWKPKTSFNDLVREMVREDLKLAKKEIIFNNN